MIKSLFVKALAVSLASSVWAGSISVQSLAAQVHYTASAVNEFNKDDTNPNHIYAVNISDGDYWVNRLIYLEEYDAIVMDYSYKYSTRPLTKEEFENSGITLVKENRPEKIYYTNDWNEQYRGTRATKLSCSSDPDGVYVVNFGWIEDREHPTDYFINRIIWDDDLEYYVIDDTFESLSLDPDEFADSDYEILRNEDGSEKTMYFIVFALYLLQTP